MRGHYDLDFGWSFSALGYYMSSMPSTGSIIVTSCPGKVYTKGAILQYIRQEWIYYTLKRKSCFGYLLNDFIVYGGFQYTLQWPKFGDTTRSLRPVQFARPTSGTSQFQVRTCPLCPKQVPRTCLATSQLPLNPK